MTRRAGARGGSRRANAQSNGSLQDRVRPPSPRDRDSRSFYGNSNPSDHLPRRPTSPPRNRDRFGQGGRRRDSPPRQPRDEYRPGGTDSYRPRPPQGDFTFRVERPPGVGDLPAPSFPRQSHDRRDRRNNPRRDARGGRGRGAGSYRGRYRRLDPHERALLTGAANGPLENLVDGGEPAKFRDLDEITDDDEQDMDESTSDSGSSSSDTGEPARKKARITQKEEPAAEVAKWSNPDPYTALPCPDDSLKKKRDVVKLIRKARVEEDNKDKLANPGDAEDFISFDLTEDDDDETSEESADETPKPPRDSPPPLPSSAPPPNAPSGPSSTSANGLHGLPPRPSALPAKPSAAAPEASGPLGSRKRTVDDEIKPPQYGQLKKVNKKAPQGMVLSDWAARSGEDSCPWATVDHSATHNMAFR